MTNYLEEEEQLTVETPPGLKNISTVEDEEEYSIVLIANNHLGRSGKYNINDCYFTTEMEECSRCGTTKPVTKSRAFGIFKVDKETGKFGAYKPRNSNLAIKDKDYNTGELKCNIVHGGETQVYGVAKTDNSLVVPVRADFRWFEDFTLHRRQQFEFYGWEELGIGLLDPRIVCMEVIDPSC